MTVKRVGRRVIENKLLDALEGPAVAMLLSEEDLDVVIDALDSQLLFKDRGRARELSRGAKELRRHAFG